MIALLRALEGHADAKAKGGAGAAASLARRGHLSAPTLGMIWDICGQVARELKGSGLPSAYDWCVRAWVLCFAPLLSLVLDVLSFVAIVVVPKNRHSDSFFDCLSFFVVQT